jgi:hypothetical protein
MDTTENVSTTDDTTYSSVVGVYRERAKAEKALQELQQAGFRETQLTVYDPHPAGEAVDNSLVDPGMRVIVQVLAEGREQEAVGILVSNGSNNSDLPPGTVLDHGSIVRSGDATNAQVAANSTAGGPSDAFFGEAKSPGHPMDISVMDNPNAPHG